MTTLMFIMLLVIVFGLSYVITTVIYHSYRINKMRKHNYKFNIEEGQLESIDWKTDMLNYKWYTGNDHRMRKLSFNKLASNECIVVTGKTTSDTKYFGLGALSKDDGKGHHLVSMHDNLRLFGDGKFGTIISSNFIINTITHDKVSTLMDDPDRKTRKINLCSDGPSEEYIFFVDIIGGQLEDVQVTKYSYDGLVNLTSFPIMNMDLKSMNSEKNDLSVETLRKSMQHDLAMDLQKITKFVPTLPLDHNECVKHLMDDMSSSSESESNVMAYTPESIHNDVTRFSTKMLDDHMGQTITVYFIDHTSTDKGGYCRLSLINEDGEEIYHTTPLPSNQVKDHVHKARILLPSNEKVQILESIYGSLNDGMMSVGPLHETIYPMSVMVCDNMLGKNNNL